jgi:PepSY-associated TM region
MLVLATLHRWLGVAFCPLFAMWFASGIVMHFVPFPALSEAKRMDGLAPIDHSQVLHGPNEAVQASGIRNVARVRLVQRPDGPIYLVSVPPAVVALRADNLAGAVLSDADLALAVAQDHAQRRGLDARQATVSAVVPIDQWTVSGSFNPDRPLFRVSLNDRPGTEIYVSSATGLVVGATTHWERSWNYAGSVVHWIYPTVLRSRPTLWSAIVWLLSLTALIASLAGAVLGLLRVKTSRGRIASPYQGWQKWHHLLGLACTVFVLTWIFSGWLSVDSGQLFSSRALTGEEARKIPVAPAWDTLPKDEWPRGLGAAKEIEWFAFNGKFYRRERTGLDTQRLFQMGSTAVTQREYLEASEAAALVERLRPGCNVPNVVAADDNYPVSSAMPHAPVYRVVCGDIWYQVDGASGAMLERLDPSRRACRWLYGGLHTLDIPVLVAHPSVRSALIVFLCILGFVFSTTAVVIGWRRLGQQLSVSRSPRSTS